jgi:hypothetical protein
LFALAISLLVLLRLGAQLVASFTEISFLATPEQLTLTTSGRFSRRMVWDRAQIADVYMIRIPSNIGPSESAAVQLRDQAGNAHDLGHGTPEECVALADGICRGLGTPGDPPGRTI